MPTPHEQPLVVLSDSGMRQPIEPHVLTRLQSHLPPSLLNNYRWHRDENYHHARSFGEGMYLAAQLDLNNQFESYAEHISDLYAKDRAERVHDSVLQQFGYDGRVWRSPRPIVSRTTFNDPISTTEYKKEEWHYVRLEAYKPEIPVHAMRVLVAVKQQPIQPDWYWVADKRAVVATISSTTRRRLLDPIIFVSYGQWLAAITEWL